MKKKVSHSSGRTQSNMLLIIVTESTKTKQHHFQIVAAANDNVSTQRQRHNKY